MRIDSHQHFWKPARADYGWLTPDQTPLFRDFLPADLAPLIAAAGIERTILVQAAETVAETEFLLAIARETPFVAGVVGWVDFTAKDAPDQIAGLAADPLLLGLRPMVQSLADDDWLLRGDLAPAFRALVAHGLVFDALVLPRHLSRLLVLLDRHLDLSVVVDHAAKPHIAAKRLEPWRADLAAVAARPNTVCKLSGLVTEAAEAWSEADLAPVAAHLLAVFGPARLLFGSDWPVVTRRASYAGWLAAAEALTAGLTDAEKAAVFGANATRVYWGSAGGREGERP